MTKENRLLPCPFCGGEAKVTAWSHWDDEYGYVAECDNCYLDMGEFETEEEAIERWNTRYHPVDSTAMAEGGKE